MGNKNGELYMLIPNPEDKIEKKYSNKSYLKNCKKVFLNNVSQFFLNFVFGFGISIYNSAFLLPILTYLEEHFLEILFHISRKIRVKFTKFSQNFANLKVAKFRDVLYNEIYIYNKILLSYCSEIFTDYRQPSDLKCQKILV